MGVGGRGGLGLCRGWGLGLRGGLRLGIHRGWGWTSVEVVGRAGGQWPGWVLCGGPGEVQKGIYMYMYTILCPIIVESDFSWICLLTGAQSDGCWGVRVWRHGLVCIDGVAAGGGGVSPVPMPAPGMSRVTKETWSHAIWSAERETVGQRNLAAVMPLETMTGPVLSTV